MRRSQLQRHQDALSQWHDVIGTGRERLSLQPRQPNQADKQMLAPIECDISARQR